MDFEEWLDNYEITDFRKIKNGTPILLRAYHFSKNEFMSRRLKTKDLNFSVTHVSWWRRFLRAYNDEFYVTDNKEGGFSNYGDNCYAITAKVKNPYVTWDYQNYMAENIEILKKNGHDFVAFIDESSLKETEGILLYAKKQIIDIQPVKVQ